MQGYRVDSPVSAGGTVEAVLGSATFIVG